MKVFIGIQFVAAPESSLTLTLESLHLIVENYSPSYSLSAISMLQTIIVSMKYSLSLSSDSVYPMQDIF